MPDALLSFEQTIDRARLNLPELFGHRICAPLLCEYAFSAPLLRIFPQKEEPIIVSRTLAAVLAALRSKLIDERGPMLVATHSLDQCDFPRGDILRRANGGPLAAANFRVAVHSARAAPTRMLPA